MYRWLLCVCVSAYVYVYGIESTCGCVYVCQCHHTRSGHQGTRPTYSKAHMHASLLSHTPLAQTQGLRSSQCRHARSPERPSRHETYKQLSTHTYIPTDTQILLTQTQGLRSPQCHHARASHRVQTRGRKESNGAKVITRSVTLEPPFRFTSCSQSAESIPQDEEIGGDRAGFGRTDTK